MNIHIFVLLSNKEKMERGGGEQAGSTTGSAIKENDGSREERAAISP